jgi:hypothetical protein
MIACAIAVPFVITSAVLISRGSPHVLTNTTLFAWAVFGLVGATSLAIAARERRRRTFENRHVLLAAVILWAVGFALGSIGTVDRGFGTTWAL